MNLLKRIRTKGGIFLLFALVLSACGNNASPIEQKETTQEKQAETRIYKTEKGDITIPAHPQRVVVGVQDYVGDVLALGIKPVGAAGWVFDTPYYKGHLDGVVKVGDKQGVSMETIIGLKPDLILTYQEESYEQLSKIASTVFIPYGKSTYRDRLIEMGKILNKEAEAKDWLSTFDKKIAEKKKELFQKVNPNEQVAIVEISDKDIFIYGKTYGRGGDILYDELGLHAPAKVEADVFETGWAKVSLEAIPDYLTEADHIFLGVRNTSVGTTSDTGASKKRVVETTIWKNLPSVKSGHIYEYDVQSMYFKDAMALNNQLDQIVNNLMSKK
ncbi:iron-hydroxamate ABC transporter substrate-binding protein [Brevibacillus laterosporus]|uniref:Ferrichrome ABC transporter substrate-binding protein n=1 Tax=Brevibacillus laterosporus TaxID=1465 RepID=A0AAP8U401_BRELA|nr:iron-hydroxamate ABC transporter substrate-binding protein [Brevibacillus laterosporus]MCR8980751.1 iron-hydroxamate ABC transporter substrate-binding protein [Brevibacillus laterosporus]MCZ0807906.1 iron-hydroxamate ABC transporter substrate-binding protein [Brevibacillus laterosporus]MCZ0826203.1 iron-hydroxamate ABC transporter substrate-binding protein [Brevibacillus laterosporus]MCZ0851214.1 iron-hydroxamate ABC transporter substrate-binding protein [Brevibacillus laterosporus]PPA93300